VCMGVAMTLASHPEVMRSLQVGVMASCVRLYEPEMFPMRLCRLSFSSASLAGAGFSSSLPTAHTWP